MKKIVMTGSTGYLSSLIMKDNKHDFNFIPVTRKDLDFSDLPAVKKYFSELDFDIVFHAAANATTAFVEENPELTRIINTEAVKVIADVCKERNKRLIFLSTEQCFNGQTKAGPFTEKDELISVTKYGQQKAEADKYLSDNLTDYVTLRLSWMFGMSQADVKSSPNIIVNTLRAMFYKKKTKFTVNEIRGMTYAQNLSSQFKKVTELETGVYNFSNINKFNTYESAKYIAKTAGFSDQEISEYIVADNERYKDRFRDYRLDNEKIRNAGIKLTTFEEDVKQCLNDFGWLSK